MKYKVVRDTHSVGEFVPTGQKGPVRYDNHMLHVLYTDVDGKPSVDKLKVKTGLLNDLGVKEDLTGKDIEVEYGPKNSIVGVRVIGYSTVK